VSLSRYPVLEALYAAKQRLARLLLIKNINSKYAKKQLPKLPTLLRQFATEREKKRSTQHSN